MAERRMFAKTIVTSDAFLDMPLSARCLYFTLGMFADDDGFVNNPKSIMRQTGASTDDLNLLIAKRFILTFESGIIVIKHWKIHNYIAKDRYKETKYLEEKNSLSIDSKGAYTECIQAVYKLDTQDRIGEDSIGEVSIVEEREGKAEKPTRHKYGLYNNVLLSDEDYKKLQEEFPHDYSARIERLSEYIASTGKSYKSHLATIRAWSRKDNQKGVTENGNDQRDTQKSGTGKFGTWI
jgi:hypothetical protein